MRNTKTYTDIDLNFTAHPVSKDIVAKADEEAIKASIRNLVMTSNYERPFNSKLGSRLKSLMFEPITPILYGMIKQEVVNIIANNEPRAQVIDVLSVYHPDENTISISIMFKMLGSALVTQTAVTLERTR